MGTLIHALEKRLREKEKKTALKGLGPLIYWSFPFVGLHPYPFCLHLGGHTLAPSILAPCVYMERPKKQASRQAKKQTNEIGKACKEQASKDAKQGQTNMWSTQKG